MIACHFKVIIPPGRHGCYHAGTWRSTRALKEIKENEVTITDHITNPYLTVLPIQMSLN